MNSLRISERLHGLQGLANLFFAVRALGCEKLGRLGKVLRQSQKRRSSIGGGLAAEGRQTPNGRRGMPYRAPNPGDPPLANGLGWTLMCGSGTPWVFYALWHDIEDFLRALSRLGV
jgi:hypothetical protein